MHRFGFIFAFLSGGAFGVAATYEHFGRKVTQLLSQLRSAMADESQSIQQLTDTVKQVADSAATLATEIPVITTGIQTIEQELAAQGQDNNPALQAAISSLKDSLGKVGDANTALQQAASTLPAPPAPPAPPAGQ